MSRKFDWMDWAGMIILSFIIVVFMAFIYSVMVRNFISDIQVRRVVLDGATCYVAFMDEKRVDMDCLCGTYEKSNLDEDGQR